MKSPLSTTTIALLLAGVIALVIQSQQGRSQSSPPPQASTFNSHYKEVSGAINVAGTSQFFSLPISDRAVRLVVTFIADGSDQDFSFADRTFLHRSTRDELWADTSSGPITPDNFPDGYNIAYGLNVIAGPNGTFAIRTSPDAFSTPGLVHVGMWY